MTSSVLHIMIIWSDALDQKSAIMDDLKEEFNIRKVFCIHWDNTRFLQNLRIFYAHSQKHLSPENYDYLLINKMNHCGNGDFVAIVFEDEHSVWEDRETSGGVQCVNTRVFDKKQQYRVQTGEGHKIHASNDAWETNKDLTILLGLNTTDFLKAYPCADSQEEYYAHDCIGVGGYSSIRSLFYVLNNTISYCVLRNHECLPDEYTVEGHGDIDLLVEDKNYIYHLTAAQAVFPETYRVYSVIKIAGKEVPFDFRFVGDDYYDQLWEQQILDSKVLAQDLYYVPNDENQFYSLLYHAYIQKNVVKDDYIPKLHTYADKIGIHYSANTKDAVALLDRFLAEKHYEYVRPQDHTVIYNKENLKQSNYAFRYGQCVKRTEEDGHNGYVYSTTVYESKESFTKIGTSWLIDNEIFFLKRLEGKKHFPQLLSIEKTGGKIRIELSRISGTDFVTFFNDVNHQRRKYLQSFLSECLKILIILNQQNVCHRDFLPMNLVVSDHKDRVKVGLIDFGWAVSYNEKHPKTPANLGRYSHSDRIMPDMFTLSSFLIEYWPDLPFVRIICFLLRKSEFMNRTNQLQLLKKIDLYVRFLFSPYDAFRLFLRRHQRLHFLKEGIKRYVNQWM